MEMQAARRPHEGEDGPAVEETGGESAGAAVVVALTFTMRYRIAIFPFCNTCARRRGGPAGPLMPPDAGA